MKRILILGAGLVAGPLVRYFLERPDYAVTVADVDSTRAQKLTAGHPRGEAKPLAIEDRKALSDEVGRADLVVSMVPYTFHPKVAEVCVDFGKDMVTASYVSPAMRALDGPARAKGVVLLNEIGLDPGIDHMEAMRIIHGIKDEGGEISSFKSYCGGLPAPESNTNPFGYKFSWSPRGVLLASKSSARFLEDGEIVSIPGEKLFENCRRVSVEGFGAFEGYPNRDSVPYREVYGIPESRTVLRGTLRYPGWCETLKAIQDLGYLDETERDLDGATFHDLTARLAGAAPEDDLGSALAGRPGIEAGSKILGRLEWLGLLSREPLPALLGSPLDVLTSRMVDKLSYEPGERDMIVLQHEFVVRTPESPPERITSTLVDYGIPHGDSSMSRTVGLPVAIAARLVLDGRVAEKGVRIPIDPALYSPILEELETLGILFKEKRQRL